MRVRVPPVKVVCVRCDQLLVRYDGKGGRYFRLDRKRVKVWWRKDGRLVADCACGAHVDVKPETLRRRAEAGEKVITV